MKIIDYKDSSEHELNVKHFKGLLFHKDNAAFNVINFNLQIISYYQGKRKIIIDGYANYLKWLVNNYENWIGTGVYSTVGNKQWCKLELEKAYRVKEGERLVLKIGWNLINGNAVAIYYKLLEAFESEDYNLGLFAKLSSKWVRRIEIDVVDFRKLRLNSNITSYELTIDDGRILKTVKYEDFMVSVAANIYEYKDNRKHIKLVFNMDASGTTYNYIMIDGEVVRYKEIL